MNNEKLKIETPWWRDGVIVFTKISAYISVPVIIASYVGEYLDNKYNSGNLLFLLSVGIAFIITIFLIWREMKVYRKKIEK
jgi:hypothetical protein